MKKTNPPVNCPKCKIGVMFPIGSKLARFLGIYEYKCDKCGNEIKHYA